MPWGTPATGGINPIQTAGYGGFTGSNVFVVAVTAVGGPYSVPGDTNLSEFGDPAVFRTMTVSKSSCDFRAPDPTGASGPYVFIDATSQPKANWNVGAPPYYFVAGTTYYFNFKNYTDQFGLGNTCPSGTCNARITVNFPK